MKLYLIEGKHYAVIGEELFEKVSEFSPLEAILENVVDVAVSRIARGTYFSPKQKKTLLKKGIKRGERRMMHCKVCAGYGHMAKTRSKRDGTLPPDEEPAKREVTKEMVDELRAAHPMGHA